MVDRHENRLFHDFKKVFMEQSYKLDSLNINTMFTQIKIISKDSIHISNMNKWCIIRRIMVLGQSM